MQVSMISVNNIPQVSVKQNSNDTAANSTFKSAVDSVVQNNKDTGKESKNTVENTNEVESNEDIKQDDKKEDTKDSNQSDSLSILVSELLNGKIDLSKLTATIKEDIQSAIKSSNLQLPQSDDKKLSDALNGLLKNLLSGDENLSDANVSQLTGDEVNTAFATLNNEIAKMLQEANTSDDLNEDAISNTLNKVDTSILSALESKVSGINSSDVNNSSVGSLNNLEAIVNNQNNTKTNPQHIAAGTIQKIDTNDTKDTYKSTVYNWEQSLKELSSNSSNENQSQFSSDDKKQNLNNSGDDFLKGLAADDKNSKFSKVSNFMAQFNAIKTEVPVTNNSNNDIAINENNFSSDMFKAITYMDTNGIKDLTVKITPKELGEVTIKLTMENGVMKANITASNKDAYNLLNSSMKDISDKLQDSNIKIQNFNIDVYNGDTTFFKDGSNGGSREEYKGRKNNETVSGIMSEEPNIDSEAISDDGALNTLV